MPATWQFHGRRVSYLPERKISLNLNDCPSKSKSRWKKGMCMGMCLVCIQTQKKFYAVLSFCLPYQSRIANFKQKQS